MTTQFAAPWPEERRNLQVGIEKLAAHGTADQMRDHLVEQKLLGRVGQPQSCIVAEYLVSNGFADRARVCVTKVLSSVADRTENAEGFLYRQRIGPVEHPPEVQTLISRFDAGDYPELVRPRPMQLGG